MAEYAADVRSPTLATLLLLLPLALSSSCSWLVPSTGCTADADCPDDELCIVGACAPAGSHKDGGVLPRSDAGHEPHDDSGPPTDAGAPKRDGGHPTDDGGDLPDAAEPVDAGDDSDGGRPRVDAGPRRDGGPRADAGAPDAGVDGGAPVDSGSPPRQLGEPCDAPSECASGFCADGVCCAEACDGECEACSANGTCGATTGAACESAPLDCGDYVQGLEGGACYRYQDVVIDGTCGADGVCRNDVTRCADLLVPRGEVLVECDAACAILPWINGCAEGTPVDQVTLGDVCVLNDTTEQCSPSCVGPSGSGGAYRVYQRACDASGRCDGRVDECGDFTCEESANGPACRTQCSDSSDCAQPILSPRYCSMGLCVQCVTNSDCGLNAACRADGTCGPA